MAEWKSRNIFNNLNKKGENLSTLSLTFTTNLSTIKHRQSICPYCRKESYEHTDQHLRDCSKLHTLP